MAIIYIVTLLVSLVPVNFVLGQGVTFRIKEEESVGTYVGTMRDANLGVQSWNYKISTQQTDFSLNDSTGDLYTMTKIDRDEKCKNFQPGSSSECQVEFRVAFTSPNGTKIIEVTVIIEDINDNAPLFPTYTFEQKLPENTGINDYFAIPRAEDKDSGSFGITEYKLNPLDPMFSLKYEIDLTGKYAVSIVVIKELDRERKDRYQLNVQAIDGGGKPGNMTVIVIVTDVNDNKPVFDRVSYNASVDEGTSYGTVLLTVNATDKDIGDNGLVRYRIPDGFKQTDFSLDSQAGSISVATNNIVYQADKNPYKFIVEAYDNGSNPKTEQVWVTVLVRDTENNKPEITINFLSSGNTGYVSVVENVGKNSAVADVSVRDSDTGVNGMVTCSVQDSFFSVQQLDTKGENFIVVVNSPLNREFTTTHTVNVTCTDKGQPPMSSSKSFTVRVTDFNDNKPIFENQSYTAKVPENLKEDMLLLKVTASDLDEGVNSQIRYEIRDTQLIVVDPVTGVVSAKPSFDHEATPVIVFKVLAIDSGTPSLTGTTTVTLSIEDVNDNSPTFIQSSYFLEVLENRPSGTIVGQLSARDLDSGTNGMFSFLLSADFQESRLPFTIFENGEIQTNKALDREAQKQYSFVAMVMDQGTVRLSSSVEVSVIVGDVNDNKPNITFPVSSNKTVSIYYPNNDLEIVSQIKAYDLDNGENGTISYSIVSGNHLGILGIDQKSGELYVADHNVKISKDVEVPLMIEVCDHGNPKQVTTAELMVSIIFSNATYDDVSADKKELVVIVVVVVVVTACLSILIIAVIFFLRKRDKLKYNSDKIGSKSLANGPAHKPTVFIMNNAGESSTDYVSSSVDGSRKKKEVSFSIDEQESIHAYQRLSLGVNMSPDPIPYQPEKPPRLESPESDKDLYYDRVSTRLESFKLQQMLTQHKSRQVATAHANPDDSRSESSGETSSGDSGRGASEEEIQSASPSHDDQKVFQYEVPSKSQPSLSSKHHIMPPRPLPPSSSSAAVAARSDNYSLVPPPIPHRSYKPFTSSVASPAYSTNSVYQYSNDPTYNNYSKVMDVDAKVLPWQNAQNRDNSIKSNIYATQNEFSFTPSRYRLNSHDDDDCSTTTSGSYTLQSIEDLL